METPYGHTLPSQLARIGGMATMPSRMACLGLALDSILPQVDHLYLYLDKYPAVPEAIVGRPKITPVLPGDRQLAAAGKFVGLRLHAEPCLYFCFDDDIIYPADYVAYMSSVLRRHQYRALVGVHANVYRHPVGSYVADRVCLHFASGLQFDCAVDELGSGTMAFHSRCIELDPARWAHTNMIDLIVAIEAVRQGVPRFAVRRPPSFLQPIMLEQADSLWSRTVNDDSIQTALLQAAVAHYPGRWCLEANATGDG